MRVAALYDIHGNLPALEAVLAEVEAAAPDLVVVGGDVVAGPLPGETLDRLAALGDRVRWVMGNADRMVIEAYDRGGRPADPEDAIDRLDAWVARQLTAGAARPARRASSRSCARVDGLARAVLPRLTAQRRGDHHRGQPRRAARADPRRRRRGRRGLRPHPPPVRPPRPRQARAQRRQRRHALRGRARRLLAVARPGRRAAAHRLRHRRGDRARCAPPACRSSTSWCCARACSSRSARRSSRATSRRALRPR